MCILFVYMSVVSHYDISVLSMSVTGLPKKVCTRGGWMGMRSIQFFLDFWNVFSFAKPVSQTGRIKINIGFMTFVLKK